jgi:hypothetical protein
MRTANELVESEFIPLIRRVQSDSFMAEDRIKLWAVCVMVIVANALDLMSTYAVSPHLANEWNVLERVFGLGWAGLIFAKIVGGCIAIFGYYFYLRFRRECYPSPGMDYDGFCRFFSFGRSVNQNETFYRMPFFRHLCVNLGYFWAGMQALIFWVALDNYLLKYNIFCPLRSYSELGYHMLQSLIVASAVLLRFYRVNYRRYRQLSTEVSDPV